MGGSAKHLSPKGYGDDIVYPIFCRVVDGDKSLVVADETIIKVAKRNIEKFDVVPLYYNMKKAQPVKLTKETMYDGLIHAFVGGNIGLYSNDISKIWNSGVFQTGTHEEQMEAINIIKILCMENNFVIDYAKTLYKPVRPAEMHTKIRSFTQKKLPHFFVYAKDKEEWQVEPCGDSFVDKLDKMIPDVRIDLRRSGIGKIDSTILMANPTIDIDEAVIDKYKSLNRHYRYKINQKNEYESKMRYISKYIKEELSKFNYSEEDLADMLTAYFYSQENCTSKDVLWFSYGKYLLKNLKEHLSLRNPRTVQCVDCKDWFYAYSNNIERCPHCQEKYRREYIKQASKKNSTNKKTTEKTEKKGLAKVRILRL